MIHSEISKLGIVVVYLVSERNEKLLDLHLNQIEKNTDVPYTIYGSANRLLPQFRSRLENDPHVRICACETFDTTPWKGKSDAFFGSKFEHSYYLEKLIPIAIEDGVSHVAILHVDSFPIEKSWAKKLADKLTSQCVLTAIVRDRNEDCKPLTAGMLFHRDFYMKYDPRLLLTEQEMASTEYQRYRAQVPHVMDSGFGYGFKIFSEGLTFYPLCRSNIGTEHPIFGGVYDDILFHIGAVAVKEAGGKLGFTPKRSHNPLFRALIFLDKALERLLGKKLYGLIADKIPLQIRRPDQYRENLQWERERELLLQDPEARLRQLRENS